MDSPAFILGPDGPFAQRLEGFAPRPQQQAMAEAVAETLAGQGLLVAEAGTGTGKTFAYLVPALLSGRKVIISTGTRNLQDQLFHKDLPVVREALAVPVDVALLKGRANYLCLHRMALADERQFRQREVAVDLQRVRGWSGTTRSGDIAELADVPDNSAVWPWVTSTSDNCMGGECDRFGDCFLAKARRRAQEADVVVVNHHLLFADMALREEGFGELLPGTDAFILDEAHQLPETASLFFGSSISGNQLMELARDCVAEDLKSAGEGDAVRLAAGALENAVRELRLALGRDPRRAPWSDVNSDPRLLETVAVVDARLADLRELLEPMAVRSKGLDACFHRCESSRTLFRQLTREPPEDHIHWFETFTRSFRLNLTPLDVADVFSQRLRPNQSWIFTSATLAVGDDFHHFALRLGLENARTCRWDSPFDYARQSLLYVPEGLPEPNSPTYTERLVEAARPVIEACRGRTFLLFTSYRALQEAARLLEGELPYPLLVQGSAPRDRLLEEFRAAGDGVLLGTSSFWEGVDVRGEALSCVVIDRLPFASPGDPVLQARIDHLRESGGNPFRDYQLPQAVITLKQGAGRLIRDVSDRGILMIGDPRIVNRSYGRVFVSSLPPMRRTRDLARVRAFLQVPEERTEDPTQ